MREKSLNKCLYVKAIYKIFISKDHDANALKTTVLVLNTLKKRNEPKIYENFFFV